LYPDETGVKGMTIWLVGWEWNEQYGSTYEAICFFGQDLAFQLYVSAFAPIL